MSESLKSLHPSKSNWKGRRVENKTGTRHKNPDCMNLQIKLRVDYLAKISGFAWRFGSETVKQHLFVCWLSISVDIIMDCETAIQDMTRNCK